MSKTGKERPEQKAVWSDGKLVDAVVAGDESAYGELVRRHYNKVLAVCFGVTGSREDSEDLVQEVFLKCFKHIAGIEEPEKFSHYLVRAAKNSALNFVKHRNRIRRKQMSALQRFKDDFRVGTNTTEVPEDTHMRESVRRRLQEMSPKIREVVSLYYLDQLRTPQIAALLDVKEAAVRKRLEYGRNALKTAMEREIQPAIQDENQRNAQIGLILLNIQKLPLRVKRDEVEEWPDSKSKSRGNRVALGVTLLLLPIVLLSLWGGFRSVIPRGWAGNDERTVFTEQSTISSFGSTSSQDEMSVDDKARENRDQSPTYSIPSKLSIQIGPPPFALHSEQLASLQEVATEVVGERQDTLSIVFPRADPLPADSAPELGDVLLVDYSFSDSGLTLAKLISDGTITPLTERVYSPEFEHADFFPNLWPAVTALGEIWAVPVYVRSWALGVNFNIVDLNAATLASNSWPSLLENLASQLSSATGTGPASGDDLMVPASWVWDCLLLEAGGSFENPTARTSAAWQRTRQGFAELHAKFPSLLSKDPITPVIMRSSVAGFVTDGIGNSPSLGSLRKSDTGWGVIAPQRPSPIPHSHFTVAAIKRSTPEIEALAWEFIVRLVSRDRVAKLAESGLATPFRQSVANITTDPDMKVFILQIQNMHFVGPDALVADNFADRNREIEEILGADKAVEGDPR